MSDASKLKAEQKIRDRYPAGVPNGQHAADVDGQRWKILFSDKAAVSWDVEESDAGFHPAVSHVLQFFKYEHLPEKLQGISKPFAELARTVARNAPDNQETTVALRKLLEAKDAAVRAAL